MHASNLTALRDKQRSSACESGKTIIYQEYKIFALRTAAVSWAKHRVVELEKPSAARNTDARGTDPVVLDTFETISRVNQLGEIGSTDEPG